MNAGRSRWYEKGYYREETLSTAFLRAARSHAATRYCFCTRGNTRETTVGEICTRAWRVAGALQALGLKAGDVFAVQLPTSYETAVLYIAAFHAGAVVVPIVHTYGPAEIEFILRDSGATWMVVPQRWREIDCVQRVRDTQAGQTLEKLIVLGECSGSAEIPWREVCERETDDVRRPACAADDVCLLLYTSGTTSRPKGVCHTHNTVRSEWEIPFLDNCGPFLNPFPAGHIAGFNFMLRPIICGVPMVLLDHWDAELAAELVQHYAVTQTGGTPYFLMTLLDAAERSQRNLSSIRSYGLGATGIKPEHIRLIDDLGWIGGRSYGLTEHSTVSTFHRDMPFEKRAFTDGRLQPGSEVCIVDEQGRAMARGEEGEILTRGPELFIGYTDPELSTDAISREGWFRTGDIGRFDKDSYLTITDRKKDIIIRGGENISSREVEEMLARHPAVLEAAAVAMPDERMGEKVCAYVILKSDCKLDLDLMQRHCRENGLARFKIPEHLQIVSDLPRNPSGKVQKERLRRQLRGMA